MMKYGYFDDERAEYVITRPDTPQPWTNYSGDRTYGTIYSHHAGGYSFAHSPSKGRLLRYSYVTPPGAQAGRYFYLRDKADGDFWSVSWLPVAKPLDRFESACRMGTAYITLESRYRDIEATATYFVPLHHEFEYWLLEVRNTGDTPRELDAFTYAEFASVWDIFHDEFNQQYANAIARCTWVDGMASVASMPHLPRAMAERNGCLELFRGHALHPGLASRTHRITDRSLCSERMDVILHEAHLPQQTTHHPREESGWMRAGRATPRAGRRNRYC